MLFRSRHPAPPDPGSAIGLTLPSRAALQLSGELLLLFVNGECFTLPACHLPWISALVTTRSTRLPASLDAGTRSCLQALTESGAITNTQAPR